MKSDWLEVKCLDVEMKCKQGHAVKCSVDHQKVLSRSSCKKPTCVLIWHTYVMGHMTKIPCIKALGNGRSTHN